MKTTKNIYSIVCMMLIALMIQGCAYTHVQRPLDTNYDSTSLGTKVGKSYSQSALWLFSWGDAGTKAAADNGNIKVITHADTEYKMILFGMYTRLTTVVYGN